MALLIILFFQKKENIKEFHLELELLTWTKQIKVNQSIYKLVGQGKAI